MIYFINDGNYTKIGYSEDILKRLKELQTGNPNKLIVNFIIPGDYNIENKWHKIFNDYKSPANNEWFNISCEQFNNELNKRFTQEQLNSYELYTIESVGKNHFNSILEIKVKEKIVKKIHNKLITEYVNDWLKNKKYQVITYKQICDKFGMTFDELKIILKKDKLIQLMTKHNKEYKKYKEYHKDKLEQLEYQ